MAGIARGDPISCQSWGVHLRGWGLPHRPPCFGWSSSGVYIFEGFIITLMWVSHGDGESTAGDEGTDICRARRSELR